MKRKRNSSVNRRKIVGRKTRSSSSTYVGVTLPIDLIMEILLRLPAKSIQVFGFASKQFSSLIRSPYFTELFLTKSLSRPRFLFTFIIGNKWHIFSSPQLRNFGEKNVVATKYHMSLIKKKKKYQMCYIGGFYKQISHSVDGFIYLKRTIRVNGKIDTVHVICNPCTGQRITLPKVEDTNCLLKISFLGSDPIGKQFKVLCRTTQINSNECYKVLTLGSGKISWRKIECSFLHYPKKENNNGICINGVLYYIAYINSRSSIIVCFDVRSEKFSYIEIEKARPLTVINYKGRLGVVLCFDYGSILAEIWVLDDAKKVKWSKHIFVLANPARKPIKSISATDSGEIVWVSNPKTYHPLCVFYYNLERQSVRRVEIKGIKDKLFMGRDHLEFCFTFTNHVENLMYL